MSTSSWLAPLLGIGGALEAATGVLLLADPSVVSSLLLHAPLAGPGVVVGRIGGGGLLALGIACWTARRTPASPASLGVASAYLAYNLVACITLGVAGSALEGGAGLTLGVAVLHGAVGAALLAALLGRAPP